MQTTFVEWLIVVWGVQTQTNQVGISKVYRLSFRLALIIDFPKK
jgi:hypothetical protein